MVLLGDSQCISLTVLFNQGDGTFAAAPAAPASGVGIGTDYAAVMASADFDGDGAGDLAFGVGASLTVLKGNGSGGFSPVWNYDFPSGVNSIAVADLNGDGKPDLIASDNSAEVTVFLGNGDGTFQALPNAFAPTGSPATSVPQQVAIADLNKDGIPDLVVQGTSATLVYLGKGDGTFNFRASYPVTASARGLALADLNNDGKVDIVVATPTDEEGRGGNLTVFLGRGDGTFSQGPVILIAVSPSFWVYGSPDLIVTDFNGDGVPDLAIELASPAGTTAHAAGIAILIGNGDGTFRAPIILSQLAFSMAAADLDGDGKTDLIVNPLGVPGLNVLYGIGDGTFRPPVAVPSAMLGSIITGKFSGGGTVDIVAQLQLFGVVTFINESQLSLAPQTKGKPLPE